MTLELAEDRDSVANVVVNGAISPADIAPPADPLRHLLGPNCHSRKVTLQFKDASYLDSMGAAWLVGCNRKFREGGGKLVLHSLHPTMLNILRVLKLDTILNIAADADSAHKLAAGEAS